MLSSPVAGTPEKEERTRAIELWNSIFANPIAYAESIKSIDLKELSLLEQTLRSFVNLLQLAIRVREFKIQQPEHQQKFFLFANQIANILASN